MIEPLIRVLVSIGLRRALAPATDLPEAPSGKAGPIRWIRRGIIGGVLLLGWLFIGWQNKFHVTAPVVFVCLGYLAVVAAAVNLWRTGDSAMSPEHEGETAWARPAGARGELEKAKRTLLKAIKEAEFDHEMGKLSKVDADELIRTYRARAIEVIKELDRLEAGQADSIRERIAREVKARIELSEKKPGVKNGKQGKAAKADRKADLEPAAKVDRNVDLEPAAKVDPNADLEPAAKVDPNADLEPVAKVDPNADLEPAAKPDRKPLRAVATSGAHNDDSKPVAAADAKPGAISEAAADDESEHQDSTTSEVST